MWDEDIKHAKNASQGGGHRFFQEHLPASSLIRAMNIPKSSLWLLALLVATSGALKAATVTLNPVADTTLFEAIPNNNLGAEPTLISGTTATQHTNRTLLKFDVTGNIPANATIQSVSLALTVTRAAPAPAPLFTLHRMLRDWGEGVGIGTEIEGGNTGAPASGGDATWVAAFHPDALWSAPGSAATADYAATASASQTFPGVGGYSFESSPDLIADVQNWLTNAANNFGWILICEDEGEALTARRFGSREDEANMPALIIDYTQPQRPRVTLSPEADTSLFEYAPDDNLGGTTLVAGSIGVGGGGKRSRALIQFSTTNIPSDAAIITSATLTMNVIKLSGSAQPSTFDLHRVLRTWGEGDKAGTSRGSPASAGEATWNARLFPSTPWNAPGGSAPVDFAAAVSSSTFISDAGPYAFTDVLPDVQFWLAHPEQNFGWILISQDEGTPYTARRFGSRESGSAATLDLEYIPRPTIEHSQRVGNQFSLSFLAQAGQFYSVECRDSFSTGVWANYTNLPPLSLIQHLTVTAPVTVQQRFYRIVLH
jgi:hypothetical protein